MEKDQLAESLFPSALVHIFFIYLSQMSWNGSEQLEKAMEEVLDDDDDDEMKVEKSNVEKMEKHSSPEASVREPPAAGIGFRFNPPVSVKGLPSG